MLVHDKKTEIKKQWSEMSADVVRPPMPPICSLCCNLRLTHLGRSLAATPTIDLLCDTFTTIDLTHFFCFCLCRLFLPLHITYCHYITISVHYYIVTLYTVALHYITFSINTYTSHTPPNPSNRRQSVAIPPTLPTTPPNAILHLLATHCCMLHAYHLLPN
jgi:hypothetical protein